MTYSQPWGAYLWQLLTTLSGAGILGLTAWLFNIESRLSIVPNLQAEIARIESGKDSNRMLIDRNSDRLTKLETKAEQTEHDRSDARDVAGSMASEIRSIREAQQQLMIDINRLSDLAHRLQPELPSAGWRPHEGGP